MTDTPRLIQVIEVSLERRGKGTAEDPVRRVRQYYSTDGVLLAEHDPFLAEQKSLGPNAIDQIKRVINDATIDLSRRDHDVGISR